MNQASRLNLKPCLRLWSVKQNFSALFDQGGETFHLINGLRFFSFFWILVFHAAYIHGLIAGKDIFFNLTDTAPPWLWWIWNADKAVDLFFVISGFLISVILFKELNRSGTIKLKRFYLRRYLRLTPIYALIVLIYWLSQSRNYEWVWTNLLYINNFLPVDKMALHWTWTLAVEEQFYLMLPLILAVLYKSAGKPILPVLIGMLLLSLLIRLGVMWYYPEIWHASYREMLIGDGVYPVFYAKLYDNLITRYGPFVCGAIAAYLYCFKQDELSAWLRRHRQICRGALIGALGVALLFTLFPVMGAEFSQPGPWLRAYVVTHRTLFAAAIAWFMLMVFLNLDSFRLLSRFLSLRCWQPLSQLTYSMYLVHFIVVYACVQNAYHNLLLVDGLDQTSVAVYTILISVVLSLLLTVIIGVLCWLLVEKPFLNMRDLFQVNKGATTTRPLHHDL
ncbi:MAG: acyltransferase [Ketobacter sp.]|nr:MAG: acyltransferase [Ketobacter sp.]